MGIIEAVLYGVIQGFAEFLPISSSGHLSAFQNLFGIKNIEEDFFAFSVLLHIGTLAAVLLVYRKDVFRLIKAGISLVVKLFSGRIKNGLEKYEKLVVCVLISIIPVLPMALLKDHIEALSSMTKVIGVFLIINGVFLFVSDKLSKKKGEEITYKSALVIGIVQTIGLFPGISRSGSSISGGLLCGVDRKEAVKYSFILSIPTILGANLLSLPELVTQNITTSDWGVCLVGMLAAAVTGVLAIKLLQYITNKNKFGAFTIYCAVVGTLFIIFG